MPLDEFTDAAVDGLKNGNEQIAVGLSETWFNAIELSRQENFAKLTEMAKGAP